MAQGDDIADGRAALELYDNSGEINFSQSTMTASQTSNYVVQPQLKKRVSKETLQVQTFGEILYFEVC